MGYGTAFVSKENHYFEKVWWIVCFYIYFVIFTANIKGKLDRTTVNITFPNISSILYLFNISKYYELTVMNFEEK